jgi:hypothetical protein
MSHENYQSCIEACYECATECRHCENACLEEKNIKDLVQCIRLTSDCAAVCLLAANLMSAGSIFSNQVCGFCASICDSCAEECKKHSGMNHCGRCAEVCRRCAEECRAMSTVNELDIP